MYCGIVARPGGYESLGQANIYAFEDPDLQLPWDAWCSNGAAITRFWKWTMALFGFALLTTTIYPILLFATRRWMSQARKENYRITIVIACLAAMWSFLIKFMLFRNDINKDGRSSNKDTQWSFGQILALASWIPVIVEIGYIWWEGPEQALSGHLVEPYEVKKRLEGVDMIENGPEDEVELLPHEQTVGCATISSTRKASFETVTQRNSTASD
jgi:hypothetical protein